MNSAHAAASDNEEIFSPVQLDRLAGLGSRQKQQIIRLMKDFIIKWPQEVERSEQLFRDGEQKEAARILHTLRGSCGTVGAKKLVDTAFKAEKSMPAVSEEVTLANIQEVKKDLDDMISAATQWLANLEEETSLQQETSPLDREQHQQFLQHLQTQNMTALTLYPELRPSLIAKLPQESLTRLDDAINHLDFSTASHIIERIEFD
ncbi:hypothetical protein BTA51_11490 [Hahella sp. CCB-MM4]|uniref:Hpt domain-containing protein n=1 Tax=Hahella sp. (strain CCB-MM4) TaxID=1926491 RepID=UPI000B9A7687|nr:Hpt domain-containing protein [Hahella sp. CCB-MM4]OZG73113.1 hypothetical protein BTA51_11490 [Hahella sp. CCB-MM4]